jgi:hypothetical protein
MCRKNRFPTKEAAKAIGRMVVKMGRADQNRAYYCQHCKAWHLTSMSLREFKQEGSHD